MTTNSSPVVAQLAIKVDGTDLIASVMDALREARVESSLYLPDMFIMTFHDDKFELVDGSTFALGAPVIFEASPRGSETMTELFEGEITAIEPSFNDDMTASLTIRGFDKSHRLNRGAKTKAFVNVTDSDIVAEIVGASGLSVSARSTSPVRDHVFQDGQTDLEFLHFLARRNGYEVWVADGALNFDEPGSGTEVDLTWGQDLFSFDPRLSISRQVDKVEVRGWDPVQKQAITGEATSSSVSPSTGISGWGGSQASTALAAADQIVVRRPVAVSADADTLAQSILDDINANFIEADGVADGNPLLRAGVKVNLENIGTKFAGTYVVTTVTHSFSGTEMYVTHFEIEGPRPRQIADLVGDAAIGSGTASNGWGGVVTALVTNIEDPDALGRVKIQYPWLDESQDSCWARLTGIGGGPETGLFWIPEVDDEVLVAFDRGDFNFPYIIGGLWNGTDATPESEAVANGAVEVRTLKTRAGHIIRLTDKSGSEMIEIIDAAEETSITMDQANQTVTIKCTDKVIIDATGDLDIKAGGNITLDATGDVEIKGVNVKGDASAALEMKAGATGKFEASAPLTLKGATVNIN